MLVFLSPKTATSGHRLKLWNSSQKAPHESVQVLPSAVRNGKVLANATVRRLQNSILVLPTAKDEIDDSLVVVTESCSLLASDGAIVHVNIKGFSIVQLGCGSDVAFKWTQGGKTRVHTVRWSCRRNLWVDEDHPASLWSVHRDPVPAPVSLHDVPEMDLKRKVWVPHGEADSTLEPELAEYIEVAVEREETELAEA